MKNIKLNTNLPTILTQVFEFYNNSNLNENSTDVDFQDAAERFITSNILGSETVEKESILSNVFNDIDLYKFDKDLSNLNKIKFIVSLDSFHSLIKNRIENKTSPIMPEWHGMKRQVSPSYEAYHFLGHNNLDVDFNSSSNYFIYDK
jgi:hypothetical protein